jgi:hypothetical protein
MNFELYSHMCHDNCVIPELKFMLSILKNHVIHKSTYIITDPNPCHL